MKNVWNVIVQVLFLVKGVKDAYLVEAVNVVKLHLPFKYEYDRTFNLR